MSDISIIVPAYNAEKYIEKCINSLIHQTKKELEFIIINDGSTDHTEDVIQSFEDKRIHHFYAADLNDDIEDDDNNWLYSFFL